MSSVNSKVCVSGESKSLDKKNGSFMMYFKSMLKMETTEIYQIDISDPNYKSMEYGWLFFSLFYFLELYHI